MSDKKTLLVKPNLCVGCHSCEIACKQLHNLPPGVFRIKVEQKGPEYDKNGKLSLTFKPIVCMQCEKPQCVDACPTGALEKQDGIVILHKSLCNACKKCIEACPINAIWFNPNAGIIEKCDLCRDKNLGIPFCAKHCMSKALCYTD